MKVNHDRIGEAARSARSPGRDYVELWISLARRNWGSLVVIPTDRDGSTSEIAGALADIGQRLSYGPVTAITMNSLEYGSALALADLQKHVERERRNWGSAARTVTVTSEPSPASPDADPIAEDSPSPNPSTAGSDHRASPGEGHPQSVDDAPKTEALVVMPPARVIISVPPVISEPLGLAAAEGADAIVLAVRMNQSRMTEVRRTIELVGRHRVTGCFLVL